MPLGGHLGMSGDTFGCQGWKRVECVCCGLLKVEAEDAAGCLIVPRAASTMEKDQPQMSMGQDGKSVLGFSLGVGGGGGVGVLEGDVGQVTRRSCFR